MVVIEKQSGGIWRARCGKMIFHRNMSKYQIVLKFLQSFEHHKRLLLKRGRRFIKQVEGSRQKIARLGSSHIQENSVSLLSGIWWAIIAYTAEGRFLITAVAMVAWDGTEVVSRCLSPAPGWVSVCLPYLFTHDPSKLSFFSREGRAGSV